MLLLEARKPAILRGFGRCRRTNEFRAAAVALFLPGGCELVLRIRLPCEACLQAVPGPLIARRLRQIRLIRPGVWIPGVLVGPDSGRLVLGACIAPRCPEPHAILSDRTT